jgi:hypothetical protein
MLAYSSILQPCKCLTTACGGGRKDLACNVGQFPPTTGKLPNDIIEQSGEETQKGTQQQIRKSLRIMLPPEGGDSGKRKDLFLHVCIYMCTFTHVNIDIHVCTHAYMSQL